MAKSGISAKSHDLQESFSAVTGAITIGIDRFSYCCVLGPDGTALTEGRVVSTPDGMARHFQQLPPTRIALEVGSHSMDERTLDQAGPRSDSGKPPATFG